MKEDLKQKLGKLFDAQDKKLKERKERQDEEGKSQLEFLNRFRESRQKLIRPAMEAIGAVVKDRGGDFLIEETEEGADASGRTQPASLRMIIKVTAKAGLHDQEPFFSAVGDKRARRVLFYESTLAPNGGGRSGSVGQSALEDLTEDLIQEKIYSVLAEVLK